jgi:hypothetical protein
MDYELVKLLKDAGFSQGGNGRWIGPPDKVVWLSGDLVYVPTLEELIAACRRDIESLTQELSLAGDEWVASTFGGRNSKYARGKSLTEAVARLWLALYGGVEAGRDVAGGGD